MAYVNTKTQESAGIGQIRAAYPNTSFPKQPTSEQLAGTDFDVLIIEDQPTYDSDTQKLEQDAIAQIDGAWKQGWSVVALSADEMAAVADGKWNRVRAQREELLTEADHLVNIAADAGDAAAEAAARSYRQSLRDITTQADPANVVWPTKPA
jgi:hypothetical protein